MKYNSSDVRCPNCKSRSFVRKGKSKDKQFQRLKCKNCLRNWSVESFLVNKQMSIPEILFSIVEHPDGMFSINKVQVDRIANQKVIKNLDFITEKVQTYEKVVELASKFASNIHPNTVKLDSYVPEAMRQQLKILFPKSIAKSMENLMESMCKDTSWNN